MGVQGLGLKKVRKIEAATGLYVLRAVANGGYVYMFIADGHVHGYYYLKDGSWEIEDDPAHFQPMCRWLFGTDDEPARIRDESWGTMCPDGRWRCI